MLQGVQTAPTGGRVEYRLARNAVVREFHRGRLSRLDVCDAHPELMRAARNLGRAIADACPICDEQTLVDVTFVFGSRLPSGGRCVASAAELARYKRRKDPVVCYVVEVCTGCSWNHLLRTFPAGAGVDPSARPGWATGPGGCEAAELTLGRSRLAARPALGRRVPTTPRPPTGPPLRW